MEPKAPFDAHAGPWPPACLRGDDVDSGDSANPVQGTVRRQIEGRRLRGRRRGRSSGVACMARGRCCGMPLPTGAFENASTPGSCHVRHRGGLGTTCSAQARSGSTPGFARAGARRRPGLFIALRCARSLPRPSSRRACVAPNSTTAETNRQARRPTPAGATFERVSGRRDYASARVSRPVVA